jgi:hypothetical protein
MYLFYIIFIYERTCNALVHIIHADNVSMKRTRCGLNIIVSDMQLTVATGIYEVKYKHWHHH